MPTPNHRVWAEIFLDRVKHNLSCIQKRVGEDTRLMPVVKANSYGHGAVQIARACSDYGVEMLAVASVQEAIQLRQGGIGKPILILGEILPSEISKLIDKNIRLTVQTKSMVRRIGEEATMHSTSVPVHVAVDTGMSRLGTDSVEEGLELAQVVRQHEGLELEGTSTHLSSAYSEEGEEFTNQQLSTFDEFLSSAREQGLRFKYVHVANSGGVFSYPESHYDMVRPGIAVYGVHTGNLSQHAPELKPAMVVRTRLIHIKNVDAGRPIGYGRSCRVEEETPVGVLPVGYHDGFPFQVSNQARVLIRGTSCPVIGRVTMDYVMVDLRPLDEKEVGDVVTLIGRDGDERITASELAEQAGTISYEQLCSIGDRVHRIYKSSID